MDDLYHQEILDHYHHPDNFGELKNADKVIEETNASCGDSFTFYVKVKPTKVLSRSDQKRQRLGSPGVNEIIDDLKFKGTGCAISTAACSLLTSHLKGKPVSAIHALDQAFMENLIGTTITPMRLKCLMLPATAIKTLISKA